MATADDQFVGHDTPADDASTITPNDTAELVHVTRAIYVGAAGDIKVVMRRGTTVTFTAVPQGTVLPVQVRLVYATGTTATNLIGLY